MYDSIKLHVNSGIYRYTCIYTYTMVVKIDQSDFAIGGYLNLLDNPIDKISTRHVFMLAMLFSRTELTLLLQVLHICMLFMFHITCTPAHINIHGISRLHNLGVGRYMIYMSLGLRPRSCKSCRNLHLSM